MPERKQYYIAEAFEENIFTAGIVRKHQEAIMQAEGFQPLKFSYSRSRGIFYKILRLAQSVKMVLCVPKDSTVLFHFPYMAGIYDVLQKFMHWRGIKTVALIIDIDGLRDKDETILKKELRQLSRFSIIVAHNKAMKDFITSRLPDARLLCMELFDYESIAPIPLRELSKSICFAGNLGKSAFIYKLCQIQQLQFNLYGEHYTTPVPENTNVIYKGTVAPSQLPAALEGSFGLVWDGPSIDTCDDYLRYNNPHKLSLYLAAGLPVIVWRDSAVAPFVSEHKSGILVNTLSELPQVIFELSAEEYIAMQDTAAAISKKIQAGYYFRSVLAEIAG